MAEVVGYVGAAEAWKHAPMEEMLPSTQAEIYEAVGEMLAANYEAGGAENMQGGTVLVRLTDERGDRLVKYLFSVAHKVGEVPDIGTLD